VIFLGKDDVAVYVFMQITKYITGSFFFLVDTWNLDQSEVLEIAAIAIRNSSNLGCGGERSSEIFVIL